MTHVQPKNVCSARDQFPDRFRFLGRRAERAADFCLPNFFTSGFWPFCPANLPHSTSIMPPLAAFVMKVLSAALSLLPALAAPFAGAGLTSLFAPVLSGG